MKTCRKRGHQYEDGLKGCPICSSEGRRLWNAAHKDHNRLVRAAWMKKNREAVLEQKRQKHHEHPEDGRRWYATLKQRKPLYTVWNGMLQRCHNPKHHKYPTYGARGITVCDRWRGEDGYANFEADMPPRPSIRHSIDRRKNNLGYFKNNCRWATRKEQQQNRRVNAMVTIGGRTQCQKAWADEVGIHISTFRRRLELGWAGENLLQPPDQKFNRMARRNP